MKIVYLLFVFVLGGSLTLSAQNKPCKVLTKGIQKEYVGKCKKGLANGKGIAKGKYTYEGHFKKGLPDGFGTFTYSKGNYYKGQWKKGLMDGQGKYYFKVNGIDSVRVGVWKKGKYIGRNAIPDYVVKWNNGVDRYIFNLLQDNKGAFTKKVMIKFRQNGGNNTTVSNISLIGDSGTSISATNYIGYENIRFPFKCKLTYTTLNKFKTSTNNIIFEFVINKPGEWELILNN